MVYSLAHLSNLLGRSILGKRRQFVIGPKSVLVEILDKCSGVVGQLSVTNEDLPEIHPQGFCELTSMPFAFNAPFPAASTA